MASKHRKRSQRSKKIALMGASTATATVLTVGMVSASTPQGAVNERDVALTAATGPNYTQLITDSSNSLNNVLFTAGNLGGAAAGIWDPLATAIPGGLLPTFTAGTTQNDLTSIAGLLATLSGISVPDLSGVPGLPTDATTTITGALLPGLVPALGVLGGPVLGTVASLGTITGVLAALNAINALPAVGGLITGIPTLGDLIPGLTVTQTTFDSAYDWPLLGLGPVLGLNGSTSISNTFAQVPSLTGSSLATGILSGLGLPPVPGLPALINTALAPLNAISTPSVTAWVPAGSGNYGLPLGGSIGWLATMPTLAVGPVAVGPIVLSDTDTVIAIPILAAGATLPLNLASAGIVTTPGVVFPTATGVSTLGGATLMSFGVPALGLGYTSLNVLSATYVGTNGINYNSGTTVATLTTPFGALPIVYSLGSVNAGTTGFGFTLPSLFTVGLLPSFQVGTAPTQQSPDGLIPASVLNLGLLVPTQTTDLVTLLGLPNPGALVTPVLNPVFGIVVAPVGSQITNALNGSVGPVANGLSGATAQLTALIAQLSGGVAGAVTPLSMATTPAQPGLQSVTSEPDPAPQTITLASAPPGNPQTTPSSGSQPVAVAETSVPQAIEEAPVRRRPLLNVITGTPNPGGTAVGNGRTPIKTAVTNVQNQLRTAVENTQTQLNDAVKNTAKAVSNAVGSVGSLAKPDSTTQSTGSATP